MNDMKRMERMMKIHRRRKRKQRIIAGCVAGVLFFAAGTVLYLTLKPKPSEEAALLLSEESDSSFDTEVSSDMTPSDIQFTVSLMGDCTLGTDENFSFDTSLNAYYNTKGADYFFANVKSILEEDDLSIVNMEGTLTESTSRNGELYAFKGDPSFVNILTSASVEAANIANNHSHDYGDQGFQDTQDILTDAGITPFGYDQTAVVKIKDVRVGLVGIYELYDHLERMQQLKDNLARVKAQGAEIVIVIFHWGNEKDTIPDYNQITLAHAAVDNGADLVVGHHAHVLQGIETYRGKTIAYGLGNFCFGGNSSPSDMDTMIFQQTFTIHNGELLPDRKTNIIPCRISSEWGYNNYQPTPATGEEADRILQKIEERSAQISATNL